MTRLTKIAAAVSLASIGATAGAIPITGTISLNQLLNSQGAGYAGSFAINSLLANNGMAGGKVNAATLSAYGFSDAQLTNRSSTSEYYQGGYDSSVPTGAYSYSCGSSWAWSPSACYGYARYNTYTDVITQSSRDDVVDSMKLGVGANAVYGAVGTSSTFNEVYNGYYLRGNGTYGNDHVNQYTDFVTSSSSGALNTSYALSAQDLLALAGTGELDFLINANTGHFNLDAVLVTLDVTAAVAAVPEPASAALMLAGFAALAASARARRRNGKP